MGEIRAKRIFCNTSEFSRKGAAKLAIKSFGFKTARPNVPFRCVQAKRELSGDNKKMLTFYEKNIVAHVGIDNQWTN